MSKRVAIVQSNYIPWKGYFDLIAAVDEFIFYDDVQFTKNDWRNRNKIKTPRGAEWISVPVGQNIHRRICDVEVNDRKWQIKHWKMLESNYHRAAHFSEIAALLEPIYMRARFTHLSLLNRAFIETICSYLGIQTKFTNARDYVSNQGKSQRIVDLCLQAGATEYVSGPSARAYLEEDRFVECGIEIFWFDYLGYPEYPQLWGQFIHQVSIVDLLFNCGHDAARYMRHSCS